MGQFKTDLIIFIALLILTLIVLLLTVGQNGIDIQFHDTYFVVDKIALVALIVGPLSFLIFLARGLTKKFRTRGPNIGLIIGLLLVALITYCIIEFQQHYLDEIRRLDDEGLPDRGQFVAAVKNKINWSWRILGLWIIGLLLLTFRTVAIWKPCTTASDENQ